jgi:hypothetical protein
MSKNILSISNAYRDPCQGLSYGVNEGYENFCAIPDDFRYSPEVKQHRRNS